ncbi:MAG: hypothetical protein JKZ03_01310 [Flavobacteriaceae bacterium]|nr:hypothetical protein [Flavobacteriaceae bacterium]
MVGCLAFIAACDTDDDSSSQEQERLNLEEMLSEINEIAESVPCENPYDWTFTAIGSKACGGPIGYLAYSLNIDTVSFLNTVEAYSIALDDFNKKWNIVSDCSVPPIPIDVACENGKAVLVF